MQARRPHEKHNGACRDADDILPSSDIDGKAWLESSEPILWVERERTSACGQAGGQPQAEEEQYSDKQTTETGKQVHKSSGLLQPYCSHGTAAKHDQHTIASSA
jgi:hypothetical protein